jgi:hypothetical protein
MVKSEINNIYFLSSLPRAGNTLLGSIINQSKNVKVTANTILTDVIHQLQLIKDYDIYKNFPDEKSFNNIIKNVFNNYYENWKVDNIIDRGPWGTPANLQYLKLIIKKPKFVIVYRPILECLASFIKIERPINVETRCHQLMNNDGIIGKNLWSIKNIIKEKENYVIIHYKDFIKNPNREIKTMFDYLKISFTNFNLSNLKQFSVNNVNYNDSIYKAHLHNIKTDKIKLNKYNVEDYLPSNVIKQYSNLDI